MGLRVYRLSRARLGLIFFRFRVYVGVGVSRGFRVDI